MNAHGNPARIPSPCIDRKISVTRIVFPTRECYRSSFFADQLALVILSEPEGQRRIYLVEPGCFFPDRAAHSPRFLRASLARNDRCGGASPAVYGTTLIFPWSMFMPQEKGNSPSLCGITSMTVLVWGGRA